MTLLFFVFREIFSSYNGKELMLYQIFSYSIHCNMSMRDISHFTIGGPTVGVDTILAVNDICQVYVRR